jgi:predicted transcriptional regulator
MKTTILQFLKNNGEQLDVEIAEALRMPKSVVLSHISQLSSAGEVICCQVTRYFGGKQIGGVSCRLSAYVPPRAAGPKPGAKRGADPDMNVA